MGGPTCTPRQASGLQVAVGRDRAEVGGSGVADLVPRGKPRTTGGEERGRGGGGLVSGGREAIFWGRVNKICGIGGIFVILWHQE